MTSSQLHVEVTGVGEPFLLLHSSGLSGRQWRKLVTELSRRGRVIVPALTGHGGFHSLPDPTPFTFRADVEPVLGLLPNAEPAGLIGHSYGGLIALQVALTAPRSVRSLTLFEPVAFGVLDRSDDADARAALFAPDLSWGP